MKYFPLNKGVVRCKYYLCLNMFEVKGEDIKITVYSQYDSKVIFHIHYRFNKVNAA